MHPRLTRPAQALLAAALVAAPGCGGAATAPQRERPQTAPVDLPAAVAERLRLDETTVERRATFASANGARSVYVGRKTDGTSCLADVDADSVGAGCNRVLFGEHDVAFVEGFEGGPAPTTITELHVAGVASPRVRSLQVVLGDGSVRDVALTRERAFLYEAATSDLHAGVVPEALRVYDTGGRRIETMSLNGPPPA